MTQPWALLHIKSKTALFTKTLASCLFCWLMAQPLAAILLWEDPKQRKNNQVLFVQQPAHHYWQFDNAAGTPSKPVELALQPLQAAFLEQNFQTYLYNEAKTAYTEKNYEQAKALLAFYLQSDEQTTPAQKYNQAIENGWLLFTLAELHLQQWEQAQASYNKTTISKTKPWPEKPAIDLLDKDSLVLASTFVPGLGMVKAGKTSYGLSSLFLNVLTFGAAAFFYNQKQYYTSVLMLFFAIPLYKGNLQATEEIVIEENTFRYNQAIKPWQKTLEQQLQ